MFSLLFSKRTILPGSRGTETNRTNHETEKLRNSVGLTPPARFVSPCFRQRAAAGTCDVPHDALKTATTNQIHSIWSTAWNLRQRGSNQSSRPRMESAASAETCLLHHFFCRQFVRTFARKKDTPNGACLQNVPSLRFEPDGWP